MDLVFLRRLTLEQLPLLLAEQLEIDAFESLQRARLVDGVVAAEQGKPVATVIAVTPYGRAVLAQRGGPLRLPLRLRA